MLLLSCSQQVHCVNRITQHLPEMPVNTSTSPSFSLSLPHGVHVQILRTHFKVTCFLGLTATATQSTLQSVCAHLGVPPEEGVVQGNVLPPNLELSVSNDRDKDAVSMAHR